MSFGSSIGFAVVPSAFASIFSIEFAPRRAGMGIAPSCCSSSLIRDWLSTELFVVVTLDKAGWS
jgi:hypothetical protein